MRILKYTLHAHGIETTALPRGAAVLSVGDQSGAVQLWAIADDTQPMEERRFAVLYTGFDEVPEGLTHADRRPARRPLAVSVRHVERCAAAGMPSISVGARAKRYDPAACLAWLAEHSGELVHMPIKRTAQGGFEVVSASAVSAYTDACRRAICGSAKKLESELRLALERATPKRRPSSRATRPCAT
jgi:hypothetical protein